MNLVDSTSVLNRIVVILSRSLPMYLSDARPHYLHDQEDANELLSQIVADQKEMIDRLGERILEANEAVAHGEFAMTFTGFHDLSFAYLLTQMVNYQKRDIEAITECIDQLRFNPMYKALAEETLGMSKGHLESLEELAAASVG